ncbi:DNA polymerase Y family protein [Corynebacterium sp. CCM 9185]|uniref:DNA polymerase Y family protein n=1 Tax=Corynebacterium marambiense TaxID=2765364 RepID=A0ABS0VVL1_9CORY|nr:DNA polymerase Y family protein [Corynebacterium marambiense]MBI8999403.1 DNA polymerase Y family protein [Corynebacterium marambiense]MCK7662241.1 DNA polymerase Y family protein [Corynebacterium marambiense]
MSSTRVLALWFPDWPVQAAVLAGIAPADGAPVAVAGTGPARGVVKVCGAHARASGVRRGMKLRRARELCPALTLIDDDPDRDARLFEQVLAGVDAVAASVEVLRSGLLVVDAAAAARYHGGEDTAAQRLIDAVALAGVDCFVGIADGIATALIAARVGAVVPEGRSARFLAPRSLRLAVAEESLDCDPAIVETLTELGVRTFGDLAALPAAAVTTRFGTAGESLHRLSRAESRRGVVPALPTTPLAVDHEPDAPVSRVDEAAFLARALAMRLHRRLADAGLCCRRLKVQATLLTDGKESVFERIWRTREPLTEQSTAERVRWQLDGWLTSRTAETPDTGVPDDGTPDSGIIRLTLDPVEVTVPEATGLWNTGTPSARAAGRALARVQSVLGVDAVLRPQPSGGRSPVERVELVPVGDEQAPVREDSAWIGALPGPHPARRGGGSAHPASRVCLLDAADHPVQVTAEVLLDRAPYTVCWGAARYRVTGWAGPWPVDERWWDPDTRVRCARIQITADGGGSDNTVRQAWLLMWLAGRWLIEASYR